jgi:VWFA-related protein
MKTSRFLLALMCWLPLAAVSQQSNAPQTNQPQSSQSPANASQPSEVEPQAWPPPNPPAQSQSAQPASPQNPSVVPAPAAAPEIEAPPHPSQSGQIQLDLVVTDKAGTPITGLDRADFTLLDNGRPAQIESFQAYGGAAQKPYAQIILIIDTVNIGFQEVSYSRFGIDQFLRKDDGRLIAPVSVYWYTDDGIQGGVEATTDGNALAAKLDATEGHLRSLTRAAGAWGAIERFEMSLQTLDRIVRAAAQQPGRKLLIWIGPGWPMLGNPNLQMSWKDQQNMFHNLVDLSTEIREAHMSLYSVSPGMPNSYTYLYESYLKGVKKASQAYLPNLDLKVLAIQSGGQVMSPSNDLAAEIEKCVRDAGAYYSISFTPPPADGPDEYHELKVRMDKSGLIARTSTGYYDEPTGRAAR